MLLLSLAIPLILSVIRPIILFAAIAVTTIGVTIGTYYLCRILTPVGEHYKNQRITEKC